MKRQERSGVINKPQDVEHCALNFAHLLSLMCVCVCVLVFNSVRADTAGVKSLPVG